MWSWRSKQTSRQPLPRELRQDGDEEGWVSLPTQALPRTKNKSLRRGQAQNLGCGSLGSTEEKLGPKTEELLYHCVENGLLTCLTPLLSHSPSLVLGPELRQKRNPGTDLKITLPDLFILNNFSVLKSREPTSTFFSVYVKAVNCNVRPKDIGSIVPMW